MWRSTERYRKIERQSNKPRYKKRMRDKETEREKK